MPDYAIPLKDAGGKLDPSVIPALPRYPSATGQPVGRMPLTDGDGGWTMEEPPDGGVSGGGFLDVVAPAETTSRTITAGTTMADLDAPVLVAAFTAPASGKVLVDLNAVVKVSATGVTLRWALRESGSLVPGTTTVVTASTTDTRQHAQILVDGLVAGQSYQLTWAAVTSTGTATHTLGGDFGTATMTVRDAPFV